jgi:hypothetical protein
MLGLFLTILLYFNYWITVPHHKFVPQLVPYYSHNTIEPNSLIFKGSDQSLSSFSVLFWNLRTFGKNRANPENGNQLYQISSSYDILLFAEIKDSDCSNHTECPLKTFFETHFQEYDLLLSPSLHYCDHRHAGSEEYAILVKKNLFLNMKMIHYEDPECLFIRTPYGIQIGNDFHLLVFHSNPNNERELVSLTKVFEQFGNRKTLMMGDLNTGCHYVSFSKLREYEIGRNYSWLLSETDYSNVEKTCPYDRIVSTRDISEYMVNGKVLNQNEEAKRIQSDHYPISIEIKNYSDIKK